MIHLLLFLCVATPALSQDLSRSLRDLVEINSGSANSNGVAKVQSQISDQLNKMGFKVEKQNTGLLVGTLLGKSKAKINFVVHADTVFEASSGFLHWAVSGGSLGTGPGVIDDKGGVVVAIAGIQGFLQQVPKPNFGLRFISSSNEEVGSTQAHDQYQQYGRDAKITLGFEPALDDGSVINARRGNRWYSIHIQGREAHAGRAHRDGINACNEMAIKLSKISLLTDYAKNVTVSIGHMEGGADKFNIVCGQADAKLDVRFSDTKERDSVHAKIVQILQTEFVKGSNTTYSLADDCPPLSNLSKVSVYQKKYLTLLSELEGHKVEAKPSGGSADVNYFATESSTIQIKSLPTILDGLGPVGGRMHTTGEFVEISTLQSRAEALKQFLLWVNSSADENFDANTNQ